MKAMQSQRAIAAGLIGILTMSAVSAAAVTNVALGKPVTLHGAPFFTGGWGGGLVVAPSTIVDGVFFPRHHQWDQGPVWWDSGDGAIRWIEIDLAATFIIESLIVQADDNDAYRLYYWDTPSSSWQLAWDVPNYDIVPDPANWGMQTRPNPDDNTERYALPSPIVTNRLRFEGNMTSTDFDFSVSEIQAFGTRISIDIKPQSCPNPLNTESKGVLPVAILGTELFDVAAIDLSTVRLEGVAPLRAEIEDVATPVGDGGEACDCTTAGPDGHDDATLKVDTQKIVAALGPVADGDEVVLTLTAQLQDGTPIEGKDCVIVRKKGR